MSLPKATKRLSGVYMMTSRIPIHIGRWDIENALCNQWLYDKEDDPELHAWLTRMTRHKAYRLTLETLQRKGSDWVGDVDIEEADADTIHDAVTKLFPELAEKEPS